MPFFAAVDLIADPDNQNNKELMAAVTGAIWKCATGNPDNIQRKGLYLGNKAFLTTSW